MKVYCKECVLSKRAAFDETKRLQGVVARTRGPSRSNPATWIAEKWTKREKVVALCCGGGTAEAVSEHGTGS